MTIVTSIFSPQTSDDSAEESAAKEPKIVRMKFRYINSSLDLLLVSILLKTV